MGPLIGWLVGQACRRRKRGRQRVCGDFFILFGGGGEDSMVRVRVMCTAGETSVFQR